jgi:hypothetical protein
MCDFLYTCLLTDKFFVFIKEIFGNVTIKKYYCKRNTGKIWLTIKEIFVGNITIIQIVSIVVYV